jgi:hypothetical protein
MHSSISDGGSKMRRPAFRRRVLYKKAIEWGLALVAVIAVHVMAARPAQAGAVIPGLVGTTTPPNDDDWFQSDLGFTIKFGDRLYSRIYISNNGFVIFEPPRYPWFYYWNWDRRSDFRWSTDGTVAVIAPFLKDVDTRGTGSGRVIYGSTRIGPNEAFFVTWDRVGYYDSMSDKLNTFQLLLVANPARGLGGFDILMNYDQIQWDATSEEGSAILYPRVGYYDGVHPSVELPESRTSGSKDTSCPASGLACGTTSPLPPALDGQPAGQYVFPLGDDSLSSGSAVSGTIFGPNYEQVAGAIVTLYWAEGPSPEARALCIGNDNPPEYCNIDFSQTLSSANGHYIIGNVPTTDPNRSFWLSADPPGTGAAQNWRTVVDTTPFSISLGQIVPNKNLTLTVPETIPSRTTLSPSNHGGGGVPTIYWGASTTLTTDGCNGGTATYSVSYTNGTALPGYESPIDMPQVSVVNGLGHYEAIVPALRPAHGDVRVQITLVCDPDQPPESYRFDVYIDPSGNVLNTRGVPLTGAMVTLYRATTAYGPFRPVPDGSAIMSPSNRANPSYTDAAGHFGWDTVPGHYIVRAEKAGCVSPTNPAQPYVETDILPVPPEWLDLRLVLDCDGTTPPVITAPNGLAAEADGPLGTAVQYQVTALDDVDGPVPVQCSPATGSVFPLGITTVTCGATDAKGNLATVSFDIYVDDTTPPVITAPESLTAVAVSAAGSTLYYSVTAQDKVDGALTPACSPASGSLFPVGTTTVSCTVTDTSTNKARVSFPVTVAYAWTGVLPPVSDGGTYPLGRTLPVKFGLDGASSGLPSIAAHLYIARVTDGGGGAESPAVSAGGSNRGNAFRFDAAEGRYIFNWSTQGLVAGTYRLRVDLGDGVLRTLVINLVGKGR